MYVLSLKINRKIDNLESKIGVNNQKGFSMTPSTHTSFFKGEIEWPVQRRIAAAVAVVKIATNRKHLYFEMSSTYHGGADLHFKKFIVVSDICLDFWGHNRA